MRARIAAAITAALVAGAAQAAPDCAAMAHIALPGVTLRIASAQSVAAVGPGIVRPSDYEAPIGVPIPRWCRVDGIVNARTGADRKPYGIGFELALPDKWNGRFLYQGGGGLDGTVRPPLGTTAAGAAPALARGFAVLSTDGGHKGAVFDRAFMADQRALLDFAEGSVGAMTPIAKALIAAHYGKPPARAYFVGCSTGGREAMLVAERYPEMFDGIVAGAPAMRTGYSNIALAHAQVVFNQASPRDKAGLPLTTDLFPPADKALVLKGLLDACDALDGRRDGIIDHVSACAFRPAALACAGAKQPGCLAAGQVKALEEAFQPPRDAAGAALYAAYPYDTGIVSDGPGIPGFLPSATPSPLGPPRRDLTLDVDRMAEAVRADAGQALTDTDRWTNLTGFVAHGGRMIFYHGMSDPWFSPWDTRDYVRRARAATPGFAAASRFYVVPGMGHCGGGANTFDRFDLLGAVVAWVERDKAPQAVPASRSSGAAGTRLLCPFPAYARYKGIGRPAAATGITCELPAGAGDGSTSPGKSG